MKLKFKAEKDDVLIFIIFALFLLYIVCLGVLNFPSLASSGKFYGVNPLPAFRSDRIASTLGIYLLILGGIFASVSSYFFEREEGLGFSIGGKSKGGYNEKAKPKDIINDFKNTFVNIEDEKTNAAGVPLYFNKNKVLVDNGEYHTLVIGATGSGKTQTVIFPTVELLAKNRESMIITDPKGEIYEATSNMLREKGYDVQILNFRDPQRGNCWNPMTLPYRMFKDGNQDKAIELLDDLASNILYEEGSSQDPFWEKTSADYFSGLTLGLFEDAKEDEINLNSISLMTTVGEEKFGGSTYIKEYFNLKDRASAAYTNASGTIMAPNETKASVISVFKQKIKLFATRENLSEMLSHSDVNLDTIGEKPTALFIVIQDEKKTYHSLVTILLKQAYETLISTAQKHGGRLPVRTNFLLDEFANMPPLKDITTMITAARSRGIRFTMIIQNFAQLDQVYTKEGAETIRGNCGNTIYLITTELKALEEISKMCGEKKSKKDDKTSSTPLFTVTDLQKMKQFEVIIIRLRLSPFQTKFLPYFKWNIKRYPTADYPTREKRELHTFDLRTFTKERKQKQMEEMIKNGSMMPNQGFAGLQANPMMGGINPSMFGAMPQNRQVPPNMPPRPNKDVGLDIDSIMAKIDAKIAELEEEEKQEALKKEKEIDAKLEDPIVIKEDKEEIIKDTKISNKLDNVLEKELEKNKDIKEDILPKEEVKPDLLRSENVIIHKENIPSKDESISDDQFFDDFFDE